MKCGSEGCTRLATARWAGVINDGRTTLTLVQCTFLLCAEHDEWYQSQERTIGAFRIGLLADEACQHTPGQREAARLRRAAREQPAPVLDRPHSGWRDLDAQFCGQHCNRRAGHCTGCGTDDRVPQVDGLCLNCRDRNERAHSWCPRGATV